MLNVREKRNKALSLGQAEARYIDDFGQMFARYGSTLTMGRLFGLLLLADKPLSLDEMSALVGVSKSGASVATRDLERIGVVRRLGAPGSRRVLYETTESMEPIFEATLVRIREGLAMVERGVPLTSGKARKRMRLMHELYEFWLGETEDTRGRWKTRRASK